MSDPIPIRRPQSNHRCGCAPGWHPDPARFSACQTDVTHVYGEHNPMVKWLREHHPESLGERARPGIGDPLFADSDEE